MNYGDDVIMCLSDISYELHKFGSNPYFPHVNKEEKSNLNVYLMIEFRIYDWKL